MGEPREPRAFNWRCALGLHAWARWSEPTHHVVTVKAHHVYDLPIQLENPYDVSKWWQDRVCADCGQTQRRMVNPE